MAIDSSIIHPLSHSLITFLFSLVVVGDEAPAVAKRMSPPRDGDESGRVRVLREKGNWSIGKSGERYLAAFRTRTRSRPGPRLRRRTRPPLPVDRSLRGRSPTPFAMSIPASSVVAIFAALIVIYSYSADAVPSPPRYDDCGGRIDRGKGGGLGEGIRPSAPPLPAVTQPQQHREEVDPTEWRCEDDASYRSKLGLPCSSHRGRFEVGGGGGDGSDGLFRGRSFDCDAFADIGYSPGDVKDLVRSCPLTCGGGPCECVDDPRYMSEMGLGCQGHAISGLKCERFADIGYDDYQIEELLGRCKKSCRVAQCEEVVVENAVNGKEEEGDNIEYYVAVPDNDHDRRRKLHGHHRHHRHHSRNEYPVVKDDDNTWSEASDPASTLTSALTSSRVLSAETTCYDGVCSDDPSYLSLLGIPCWRHSIYSCERFHRIGFTGQQVTELIERCPCSCNVPCR